ncbi:MAG: transglycosylase SLT domain-containing protein [Gammaproteobacteria bacterium]|nr:transglycosylase SLT domain-containing protein [Gammaproteobacteria bacterium]
MFRSTKYMMVLLGALWTTLVCAAPDIAQQRTGFEAAERALKQGNQPEFQRLLSTLGDYPLYPYLLYQDLQPRLDKASALEVHAFLRDYPDTLLAPRLHAAWLQLLASRNRWDELIATYRPTSDVEMQCLYRKALLETGNNTEALRKIEALWLSGRSQPAACDSVFDAWRTAGGMTKDLVWQRLRLALEAGQIDLARALGRFVAPDEQRWADLWGQVHEKPELILNPAHFEGDQPVIPSILAHGIKRMARSDAARAAAIWDDISTHHVFTMEERNTVQRVLALALVSQKQPGARARLDALTPAQEDPQVREKRILLALNDGDWSAARRWVEQLNEEERSLPRWRYWRARALEQLGFAREAAPLFTELASGRDYYGFLAADRMSAPYALTHRPLSFPATELAALEQTPGVMRSREFHVLGRTADSRREWNHVTRDMNEAQLLRAAKLAHDWGWHDRAIFTVARAPRQDDLDLLFPLEHRERVESQARDRDIDPAWVYGILRQESAFVPDARSPVGALGLMQIMPATGGMIAKSLKTRLSNPNDLLLPDTSIRFGAAYLRSRLDTFDNNAVLATAAYNAGAGRVKQWLPQDRVIAADLWVENIPFKETRDYVRRVLTYTVIYQQRLGSSPTLLSRIMLPVGTAAVASGNPLIAGDIIPDGRMRQ